MLISLVMTFYDKLWSPLTNYEGFWPIMTAYITYEHLLPLMTTYDHLVLINHYGHKWPLLTELEQFEDKGNEWKFGFENIWLFFDQFKFLLKKNINELLFWLKKKGT